MANTFVKIAAVTVGAGGAANIDFTSIPSTYTDLCVKVSSRTNLADTEEFLRLEFNGSGGTAYSYRNVYGNGSAAVSLNASGAANVLYGGITNASLSTSNTFSNCDIYIPNYAGSNNKSFSGDLVNEQNATKAFAMLVAGLWANTSAITSLKLTPSNAGTLVQYTTATLYGIKNS
jgi:hypothetical protein